MYVVLPYDLEGATQGNSIEDACRMATDWLQLEVDDWQANGAIPPKPTFGNKPAHGGRNLIVAVTSTKPLVLDWEKAQEHFEDLVAITALTKNATTITRYGEPAAKLVPYEAPEEDDYEEEAEDEE